MWFIQLEILKRNKPKEFWRYFNLHNVKNYRRIPLNAFKTHFKQMFTGIASNQNKEAEEFNSTYDFSNFTSSVCDLDNPITYNDVCKAISLIKKNKSPGVDKLLNEYFIEACDIPAGYITELFHKILNSGFFLVAWTKGIIVPIHKKVDKSDVKKLKGNYIIK